MAIIKTRLQQFDTYLRQNKIPIDGLNSNGLTPGPNTVTIQFQSSATQEQKDWATQALLLWDFRPRKPLDPATIAANMTGLIKQQSDGLTQRLLALLILNNPDDVQQALLDLNIALPVDEIA